MACIPTNTAGDIENLAYNRYLRQIGYSGDEPLVGLGELGRG